MSAAVATVQRLRLPSGRFGRWALATLRARLRPRSRLHLWLRDSSLVAVKTVKVEGVPAAAADAAAVREALVEAGREMTTLHRPAGGAERGGQGLPAGQVGQRRAGLPEHADDRGHPAPSGRPDRFRAGAVAVAADGTILRGLPAADLQLPPPAARRGAEAAAADRNDAGAGNGARRGPDGAATATSTTASTPQRGWWSSSPRGSSCASAPAAQGRPEMARRRGGARRPRADRARLCRPDLGPSSGGRGNRSHAAAAG